MIPTPHKSCRICEHLGPDNVVEPRFNFVTCLTHRSVPPAYIDEAVRQFKTNGKTEWDRDEETSKDS